MSAAGPSQGANTGARSAKVPQTSGVLVVRPSSLGDVVYALALVADIIAHDPQMAIDWVAEETFAPLVRLDPRIRHVIPVAVRRWRGAPFAGATWREFAHFRHALREHRYDAILDLQEQVKGAIVARLAIGTRHGLDRHSIREPLATWFDDVHHAIPRNLHFVDKCRALAAAALGYAVSGPPRWQFAPGAPGTPIPEHRYALVFHATSRDDKLWPEDRWRALLAHFAQTGLTTLVPWGSDAEGARSRRLAAEAASAIVPPRRSLPELAALMRHAAIVVGVDTGLTHLAAAIGTPTLAVFTVTDAGLAGVARTGSHAFDVGGNGVVPSLDDVIAATGRLLRIAR